MTVACRIQSPQPFYFGPPSGQLYGCLHTPQGDICRQTGIVLCQPIGDEYVRSHRACAQLARRLAGAGFPVLRFDYFGCGDSAGDECEASWTRWGDDVRSALREIRDRSGVRRLCLVGLRLGAALALTASSDSPEVDAIVLWDPVTDGHDYLESLKERHRQKLTALGSQSGSNGRDSTGDEELLGYAWPERLRDAVRSIGHSPLPDRLRPRILLFESRRNPSCAALADLLRERSAGVDCRRVPDHPVWQSEAERMLVPHRLLEAIVRALAEVCP